jgi:polyhydroxyalkanoate synthesis repressor PhaR
MWGCELSQPALVCQRIQTRLTVALGLSSDTFCFAMATFEPGQPGEARSHLQKFDGVAPTRHVSVLQRSIDDAIKLALRQQSVERAVDKAEKEPAVIKKYANRRLYNTETSTYVTLDDLAVMVRAERDFVVYDAKSGDELTHTVLTQIIVEQESRKGGQTLLPVPFLRQLIRFYGDSIERMVPSYLQMSLDTLTKEQARFRKHFTGNIGNPAFDAMQDQTRKNLVLFEQAMTMFKPFGGAGASSATDSPEATGTASAQDGDNSKANAGKDQSKAKTSATKKPKAAQGEAAHELAELKVQLADMQAKLERLSGTGK